jgi:excinuclease ABC subunit C
MRTENSVSIERIRRTLPNIPTSPGVYIMKDAEDRTIYVGKAKNLRNRVRSYFSGEKDPKTAVLVGRVDAIETVVTRNEYEALLLENNLIKKWNPRYNINLKDGKTYPVIRVTNEDYPRVFKTRSMIQDGSVYFGPFTNVRHIDTYLELIERIYPLRKCRGPIKKREHPCLYYHLGRCAAVCAGKTDKKEYDRRVAGIKKMLSGETTDLRADLQSRMEQAAANMQYERAAEYRDTIRALDSVEAEQQVVDFDPETRDYVGYASHEQLGTFVVFQMRAGKLLSSDMFRTDVFDTEVEDLTQFIVRYYEAKKSVPARLFVPVPVDEETLQAFFRDAHGAEVRIALPEETRDRSIINMARENARQDIEKRIRERGNVPALEELARVLELPNVPLRIEGFDIAHVGGKHPVASMVSFLNGIPNKAEYRRYHVRGLEGKIDDYEAMREIVARRYTRVLNERKDRPDLIVVDGGKGQVAAVKEILNSLGLDDTPLLGLAKQNEEIFLPARAEPVNLPEGSPPLRLLQHVRDESHRFATSFRARMQQKEISASTLERVPGIGPKRSKQILQAFGGLETVAETPPDMIAKTVGITEEKARQVRTVARAGLEEAAEEASSREGSDEEVLDQEGSDQETDEATRGPGAERSDDPGDSGGTAIS